LHNAYKTAERIAAQWCDHFISVSDAMTDQYVAANVAPRDKFTTIFSGMEVDPFLNPPKSPADVRSELGLKPQHVVIGKIARLFPLKGHEYLIEAAADVLKSNSNARFLLVGDGILREQYEARLRELGIRDQFVLTGLVPPVRIPELINAMDIVVHTSMWEGLARVLPQGLISAKPVVSFDIDGAKDVVIPDETGFLIEPKNTAELVEAISTLAADADLRKRLGETGRERFTDLFRHETMTAQIREVYQRVLKQRQS
jgi:glycosyltransferase involved in cell wall biosynthesis